MDLTANFFINEPQNLGNNFFNPDKKINFVNYQLVSNNIKPANIINNSNIKPTNNGSLIARLETLCQATYNSNDLSKAKCAVDSLVSAANSGCCFIEKYIVILVNFCTKHMLDELLDKVLDIRFDRQQMIENLRRHKLNSTKQLLQKCHHMLEYREQIAVDWLYVVLDAYFVELATSDDFNDVIEQISAHINLQCALLCETETSKSYLKAVVDYCKQPPKYYVEQIEF